MGIPPQSESEIVCTRPREYPSRNESHTRTRLILATTRFRLIKNQTAKWEPFPLWVISIQSIRGGVVTSTAPKYRMKSSQRLKSVYNAHTPGRLPGIGPREIGFTKPKALPQPRRGMQPTITPHPPPYHFLPSLGSESCPVSVLVTDKNTSTVFVFPSR